MKPLDRLTRAMPATGLAAVALTLALTGVAPAQERERGAVTYDALTRRTIHHPLRHTTLQSLARSGRRMVPGFHRERVFRQEGGSETVFGGDDRRRRNDTTIYPWRAVCKLFMTFPDGRHYVGTGTMIGKNDVLTAAHCVYDQKTGQWASEILVVPGLDGDDEPYSRAYMRYETTFQAYVDGDKRHDIALLTLDREIGEETGWLGYRVQERPVGVTAHLSAYSGDVENGLRQYYAYGPIEGEDASGLFVYYHIDMMPGASGGALFELEDGERWVFAVNAQYTNDWNIGCRIDEETFAALLEWTQAND
jgi:V8-like Glu-specific endopeptidase